MDREDRVDHSVVLGSLDTREAGEYVHLEDGEGIQKGVHHDDTEVDNARAPEAGDDDRQEEVCIL